MIDLNLSESAQHTPATASRRRSWVFHAGTAATQLALAALVVFLGQSQPPRQQPAPREEPIHLVWIASPGPGGGGGGSHRPPSVAQRRAPQPKAPTPTLAITPPVVTPPVVTPEPEPLPTQTVAVPALMTAANIADASGTLDGRAAAPGGGGGRGTGSGPGDGSGLGAGTGGGAGGGAFHVGNGVTSPVPTYMAKPKFTAEAVSARQSGVVVVECIVQPEGTCSDFRVVRSLGTRFGLDGQAVEAARRWRFRPGTRQGQPVPVWVSLEIGFDIH